MKVLFGSFAAPTASNFFLISFQLFPCLVESSQSRTFHPHLSPGVLKGHHDVVIKHLFRCSHDKFTQIEVLLPQLQKVRKTKFWLLNGAKTGDI